MKTHHCNLCGREIPSTGKAGRPRKYCDQCRASFGRGGKPVQIPRYLIDTANLTSAYEMLQIDRRISIRRADFSQAPNGHERSRYRQTERSELILLDRSLTAPKASVALWGHLLQLGTPVDNSPPDALHKLMPLCKKNPEWSGSFITY